MPQNKIKKSRRNFLVKSLSAVPLLAFGSVAAGAITATPANGAQAVGTTEQSGNYTPSFFSEAEYAFITAAVARLIPQDDLGPGAVEAGVPEFIDRQLQSPFGVANNWYMQGPFHPESDPSMGYQLSLKPAELYRLGIADANAFAGNRHGQDFSALTPEQQDELLGLMESGSAQFERVPSRVFFSMLLQNTREGFFSDPKYGGNRNMAGWKLVGFPGARADFMDWVERGERYPFPPVAISGARG